MKEIPETVILDMQKSAYARKHSIAALRVSVRQKQDEYESAKRDLEAEITFLNEIADFLQANNSDAMKSNVTWHQALGLRP